MSEAEIVRLVRCPKCQNLLPELAGYSVYQCGGCGAVLTAKAKVKLNTKVLAEKSDEGKLGVYDKLGDLSGKDVKENVKSSSENFVSGSHFSNEDIGSDFIAVASEDDCGVKMDKCPNLQHAPNSAPDATVDPYLSGIIRKLEKPAESVGNVSKPQGSEHMSGLQRETSGQCGNVRDGNEGGQPLQLQYQEDGPSKYIPESSSNYAKPGVDVNLVNRHRNNGDHQKERAELLQMMEELSDQLRCSGNLSEKMKDKSPMKRNTANQGYKKSSASHMFNNKDTGSSVGMHESFTPDKPTISPYDDPHYLPPYPHGGRQTNRVCSPHHCPTPFSFSFEHQIHHPFYYPGQPFIDDPAMCVPNLNNGLPHHPVCGFYNCCNNHHRATQPDYLDDTRFYDINNNPMLYPPNLPGPSAQRGYSCKIAGLSSTLVDRSVQTRFADRDMRRYSHGYVFRQQEKGKRAKVGVGLHCQPIASGAPFIICQGCSKLLQLPKMTFKHNSERQIFCCGACSTVGVCALIHGKFTLSVSGESKKIEKRVSPHIDDLAHKENSSELGWAKLKSALDDFCSSNHDSHGLNGNLHVSTRGLDLTSNETQDSQSLPASSPDSFDGVESSENLASLSPYDLMHQDQLGNSFNVNVTSKVWKGSQSTRSDHEKVMPKDMISRQNSFNETSTAQIEEVSFNIYSKMGASQKSDPTTLRNDTGKIKGSSFAGVIKKSFKGLSRSNHSPDTRDRNVTVNGSKIPDRLVKKAEKLAGPIQPGNYWYDFRAGFWGVIGGPCLGIIPPCIEEISYPMQANCSSGTTGVFVNGRELQQIDLDLLASRGLPTARGRSYVIDISGKVVDKDSGEELDGLGKLAPTIEKVKHGFGMKPHTQVAR